MLGAKFGGNLLLLSLQLFYWHCIQIFHLVCLIFILVFFVLFLFFCILRLSAIFQFCIIGSPANLCRIMQVKNVSMLETDHICNKELYFQ